MKDTLVVTEHLYGVILDTEVNPSSEFDSRVIRLSEPMTFPDYTQRLPFFQALHSPGFVRAYGSGKKK